jgi:hypothetical protein
MWTIEGDPRWRDLLATDPDLAFETDARGRIVYILGWRTGALVGKSSDRLLAEPDNVAGFNPFCAGMPVRGRRAWLNRAGGGHVCLRFTCLPLLDNAGLRIGTLGAGTLETEAAWLSAPQSDRRRVPSTVARPRELA